MHVRSIADPAYFPSATYLSDVQATLFEAIENGDEEASDVTAPRAIEQLLTAPRHDYCHPNRTIADSTPP